MRRIGQALGRLGQARAFLAGAAILAGAAGPVGKGASDAPEDIALAVPRVSAPDGSARVALPQPLSPSEAERVKRIFALQARSDLPAAISETEQLIDLSLLPDILADRYLGDARGTSAADLSQWLARHADLPQAPAVHALLARKAPAAAAVVELPPALPALPQASAGDDVEPTERLFARNAWLDRAVHEAARIDGRRAVRLVARTKGLSALYGAQLRAEVAQIVFSQGLDEQALSLAQDAHRQAGGAIGLAPYVAGLAAWRLDRRTLAFSLFKASFDAKLAQPGQRAGGAFWAARCADDEIDGGADRKLWLRRAAENGRTFYGLLARRSLGRPVSSPSLRRLTLGEADVEAVDATAEGHRAFALLQVGQTEAAAAALQALWAKTRDRPAMTRSILLVARQAGLAGLAGQLAMLVDPPPVRLPERRLRPAGGFQTDPALLYALARLESNFDPYAVSRAGARGLMQLMPSTVEFLLGRPGGRRWHDPAVSLDLGQRYLLTLAQYDLIGGDLIRLLASYNSGPGSMGKWIGGVRHNGDPLLFIESVPNDETRAYIPRALTYTWLYAAELGLRTPSLDDLVAGAWPRFQRDQPGTPAVDAQVATLQ